MTVLSSMSFCSCASINDPLNGAILTKFVIDKVMLQLYITVM